MVLTDRLIIIACVIGACAGGDAQGVIVAVFRAVRSFVRLVLWPQALIRPDSRLPIAKTDHVPQRGARSPHVVAVPSGVLWYDVPLLFVGREPSEPCVQFLGSLPSLWPRDHHCSTLSRGFNLRKVAAHVCRVLYSVPYSAYMAARSWINIIHHLCPQGRD